MRFGTPEENEYSERNALRREQAAQADRRRTEFEYAALNKELEDITEGEIYQGGQKRAGYLFFAIGLVMTSIICYGLYYYLSGIVDKLDRLLPT